MTPIACNCEACRSMCAHSVCLPTPSEARDLVKRYPGRMGAYVFADGAGYIAPATVGHEGKTLSHTRAGACTFHGEGGCELHDNGKPLEGRLAHHTRPWQAVRLHVIQHWHGKQFESVRASLTRVNNG